MQTECEVKLLDISPTEIKEKLLALGAVCVQERTFMKRVVFDHPAWGKKYFRVRDEWGQVTITAKDVSGTGINMVQELETTVGSFDTMVAILERWWFAYKSYQETRRELWEKDDLQFMLDERPGLAPFVEIEWPDEQTVRAWVQELWYSRDEVVFGAVDEVYHRVYGVSREVINAKSSYKFGEKIAF